MTNVDFMTGIQRKEGNAVGGFSGTSSLATMHGKQELQGPEQGHFDEEQIYTW